MGTANSRSLCRPKDRVPAVGQEKKTGVLHYEAVVIHCTIDDNVRFTTPYSVLLSAYNDPDSHFESLDKDRDASSVCCYHGS